LLLSLCLLLLRRGLGSLLELLDGLGGDIDLVERAFLGLRRVLALFCESEHQLATGAEKRPIGMGIEEAPRIEISVTSGLGQSDVVLGENLRASAEGDRFTITIETVGSATEWGKSCVFFQPDWEGVSQDPLNFLEPSAGTDHDAGDIAGKSDRHQLIYSRIGHAGIQSIFSCPMRY
jgi:hypothetical protein